MQMMITPEQYAAFAATQTLDQPKQHIIGIQQQSTPVDLSVLAAVIPPQPPVQPTPQPMTPIVFAGKQDPQYGWLHPQFPSTFKGTKGGQKYFSAEHYYCEKKAVLANDEATRQNILAVQCVPVNNNQFDWAAVDAAHAQVHALSRSMTTLNPVEWLNHAVQMMRQALTYKFCQDETLFKLLLATGNAYLIYALPLDGYWGIGCTAEQAMSGQIQQQQWGHNYLGQLLMELRQTLQTKGRPEWGYVMKTTAPQPSFNRKRSADNISTDSQPQEAIRIQPEVPAVAEPVKEVTVEKEVVIEEVKIDETPLAPVQEQVAAIEEKQAPIVEVAVQADPNAPNPLLDLFGK